MIVVEFAAIHANNENVCPLHEWIQWRTGRESVAVSAVFIGSAFRKVIADIQSQDSAPEALIPQEPFDVGRTWASVLWPLSKTNRQNAVTYRMASPLGTSFLQRSLHS